MRDKFPRSTLRSLTMCFLLVSSPVGVGSAAILVSPVKLPGASDPSITETTPRWSADGRYILFSASRNGNYDIFRVPDGGGSPTQLTSHQYDELYPSLGTDNWLYFERAGLIYRKNISTQSEELLSPEGGFSDWGPTLSSDGQTLAWAALGYGLSGRWVVTYNISTRVLSPVMKGFAPSWSRDGTRLSLFTVSQDTGLVVIRIAGGAVEHNVPGGPTSDWSPTSPHEKLVFEWGDLWEYDLGSKQTTRLTNGFQAENPSWSPDGSQIAFAAGGDIWVMNVGCTPGVDSDGDGLEDCWEVNGYDADGDGVVDIHLEKMGTKPGHKDLFVEVDWMAVDTKYDNASKGATPSHEFIQEARDSVIAMFARAPIENPDGSSGITLHLDCGQDRGGPGEYKGGGDLVDHKEYLSLWSDVDNIKSLHFDPKRKRIFHYCVFAHRYSFNTGSSGNSRQVPSKPPWVGHDFVVTLGDPIGVSKFSQAGTFAHELGHNLGLCHGGLKAGQEDLNYKPNYLSIMNYMFQDGLIVKPKQSEGNDSKRFDFSRWGPPDQPNPDLVPMPDLNEEALDESRGLSGPSAAAELKTAYACRFPEGTDCRRVVSKGSVNDPIDWIDNGGEPQILITSDIGGFSCWDYQQCIGVLSCSNRKTLLSSWNDWKSIDFTGLRIGSSRAVAAVSQDTVLDELTWDEYMHFAILPGDMNDDKVLDVFDVVALINYVFAGAPPPNPTYRASVDCLPDQTDVFDIIYLIDDVFSGGPIPCK